MCLLQNWSKLKIDDFCRMACEKLVCLLFVQGRICFTKYYFCLCLMCSGGNCFTRYNPPPLIYLLLLLLLLPDLDAATHRHHLPAPIRPFQSGFFSLFRAFESKDFLQGGFEEELAKLEGSAMSPDGISWWWAEVSSRAC